MALTNDIEEVIINGLRFDAVEGTVTSDGYNPNAREKTNTVVDTPFTAVFDFHRAERGWLKVAENMFSFIGTPVGSTPPTKPADDDYKIAVRIPVYGPAIGGLREVCTGSTLLRRALSALHDAYEAAPEAHQGKLPAQPLPP